MIVGGDGVGFTPKVVAGCQQSGCGVQRIHFACGFRILFLHNSKLFRNELSLLSLDHDLRAIVDIKALLTLCEVSV